MVDLLIQLLVLVLCVDGGSPYTTTKVLEGWSNGSISKGSGVYRLLYMKARFVKRNDNSWNSCQHTRAIWWQNIENIISEGDR